MLSQRVSAKAVAQEGMSLDKGFEEGCSCRGNLWSTSKKPLSDELAALS